jgi:NADP-dependent aldehyde dehydrogenase
MSFEILARALGDELDGVVGIVYGQSAGRALVTHFRVKAIGFTGSLGAARALMDAITERDEPIPFYGELSSVNPVVVLPGAAQRRGLAIAEGLAESVFGSAGQLCTKPGVALVPTGDAGDELIERMRALFSRQEPMVLLNERVREGFVRATQSLVNIATIEALGGDAPPVDGAVLGRPHLLVTDTQRLNTQPLEEAFGPLIVIVRYSTIDDALSSLHCIPPSLTATIHGESEEESEMASLAEAFVPRAGRLIFNGYPTGVRVSWAQNHGGPWPATNTIHTSVGVASMRRFLRPMSWQNAPQALLPIELRDSESQYPKRVDGALQH